MAACGNDRSAISYWLSKKPDLSLTLCILLSDEFFGGEVKKEMVSVVLDKGADPNVFCDTSNTYFFSPLTRAIHRPQPDIVPFLLSKGADPNLHLKLDDSASFNPLMSAVQEACGLLQDIKVDKIRILIDAGSDLNYQNGPEGLSSLILALIWT